MRRSYLALVPFVFVTASCGPSIDERFAGHWVGTFDPPISRSKPRGYAFTQELLADGPLSLDLRKDGTFNLSVDRLSGEWQIAGRAFALAGRDNEALIEGKKLVLGIRPVLRFEPMDENRIKWQPAEGIVVVWKRAK